MTRFAIFLAASLLLPIISAAPAPPPMQNCPGGGGGGGGGGGPLGGGGGGGGGGSDCPPVMQPSARARARARRTNQMTMGQMHNTKGLTDYGLDFTICPDVASSTYTSSRVSSISSMLSCTYSAGSTGFMCTYDAYSGKLATSSPASCEGSRSHYADIGSSSYTSCPNYTGAALASIDTIAQASGDSVLCLYDTGAQCSYDTVGGNLLSGSNDSVDCAPENSRDVALRPTVSNKASFLDSYVPKRSIANLQQKAKALRAKVNKLQKKLV